MSSFVPPADHPWRKQIRESVYIANLRNRRDSIEQSIKLLQQELREIRAKLKEAENGK